MTAIISFALGGLGWTLAEYLLHRFNGHEMKGRTRFSREHLAHHADVMYFAPTAYKVATAALVGIPMASLGMWLVGPSALAFTLGFLTIYAAYEVLHRRIHTHPPLNRYAAWARRHHLHHHFNSPKHNHGVTTNLWDRVFGTLSPADEQVRVPRRHAPGWMVDGQGDLRPRFAEQYVLKGRAKRKRSPAA